MKQTAAFLIFLVLVCSNYTAPEPLRSPLALPMHGVAGIAQIEELDGVRANAWYSWCLDHPWEDERFISMIRDADDWQALYSGDVVITPMLLLGFNEPDLTEPAGCELTPEEAVPMEHWRLEHYPDAIHVSPAPSQNDTYWLYRLRNLYIDEYGEPPTWDYLACHCYFYDSGSLYQCKLIVNRFVRWADSWGADGVLVTEFAAGAISDGQEFDYATAAALGAQFVDWLDAKPEVAGRFWFSARDWPGIWPWYISTALFDNDGNMTPLGEMYRDKN